ncbi:PaaI family thioesterase [Pseudorhodoplanes sp.]|uniref:PaaI family thioesterase n=1 Tax=Pseudorhodoplanes sp. TaxID=1934341 RepID=UPI0039196565
MSAQNPDRRRIRAFLEKPEAPLAFDSSPLLVALGTTILSAEAGRIALRFEPSPMFLQGASVVQGGAVSAMLDFAMAAAIMTALDDDIHFATASLTVSFLTAVKPGHLLAEGEVDRLGRRNGFARASLRSESGGAVLATASSVLTLLPGGG